MLVIAAGCTLVAAGIVAAVYGRSPFRPRSDGTDVFADATRKVRASCGQLATDRTMVAVLLGQSNAANHGELVPTRPHENLFNYFDGGCFEASDPLLGATGTGASVWTRVGRRLLDHNVYERVILAPLAVSGATVQDWAPGGKLAGSLVRNLAELEHVGLAVTSVMWQQGEADAADHTSRSDYERRLRAVIGTIRSRVRAAPIYVSSTSRCALIRPDPEIRAAQAAVVDRRANILAGPDVDALDERYRYDGCHFNDDGLEALADLWIERLGADR